MTRMLKRITISLTLIMFFSSSAYALQALNDISFSIETKERSAHAVRIKIDLRPTFTYYADFDSLSNFAVQTVLVTDEKTGDIVSAFRQSDTSFVEYTLYLPPKYISDDGRYHLTLSGSSDWLSEPSQNNVEIVSTVPIEASEYIRTYQIAFGKPDDLPFIGREISYAEGAYRMVGSWFHNKFFRYANDHASLRLPLSAGSKGHLGLNFYLSAETSVKLNDKELRILPRSLGTRFFQDDYRVPFEHKDGAALLSISNIAPFRAMPTNMRQMAFALNSLDIIDTSSRPFKPVDLRYLMNQRLDGAGVTIDEVQSPTNPLDALLTYQGAAWLPTRSKEEPNRNRAIDAVVLLDPALNDLVNISYSTGDPWVNSAAGAAMMLEKAGFSVAYAYPSDLAFIAPKIIYVPSQPYYGSILSEESSALIKQAKLVIFEPSFSKQFWDSNDLIDTYGISLSGQVSFVNRDTIVFTDEKAVEDFALSQVFQPTGDTGLYKGTNPIAGLNIPTVYTRINDDNRIAFLAFPAGFGFYNYGLRSHLRTIEGVTASIEPFVSASSHSQVRAFAVGRTKCGLDIAVENNNVGTFNYYGFAETYPVVPNGFPPQVSEVAISGTYLKGRDWRISNNPDFEVETRQNGEVLVRHLSGNRLLSLIDKACL